MLALKKQEANWTTDISEFLIQYIKILAFCIFWKSEAIFWLDVSIYLFLWGSVASRASFGLIYWPVLLLAKEHLIEYFWALYIDLFINQRGVDSRFLFSLNINLLSLLFTYKVNNLIKLFTSIGHSSTIIVKSISYCLINVVINIE